MLVFINYNVVVVSICEFAAIFIALLISSISTVVITSIVNVIDELNKIVPVIATTQAVICNLTYVHTLVYGDPLFPVFFSSFCCKCKYCKFSSVYCV